MLGPVTASQLAAFSWDATLHITLPSHLPGFFLGSIVQGLCAIGLYLDLLTFVTDEVQTPKEHTRPRITPYSTVRGLPVQRLQHRAGDPRSLSYYQNTKQIAFWGLYAQWHLIGSVGQNVPSQMTSTCKALLSQKMLVQPGGRGIQISASSSPSSPRLPPT